MLSFTSFFRCQRAILVLALLISVFVSIDAVEIYGGRKRRFDTQGLNSFLVREELNSQTQIIYTRDEATSSQKKPGGENLKKKNRLLRLSWKDDVLALPDRFSVLKFDQAEDFAELGNDEEESRRVELSFWGRLYIDGLPYPVQYFRAHFGTTPANDTVSLLIASPANMCDSEGVPVLLNSQSEIDSNTVVVVERGDCTFSEKALLVNRTGAAGILYINNEVRTNHTCGVDAENYTQLPIGSQLK